MLVTAHVLDKRLVFVVTVLEFDGPHDIWLGGGVGAVGCAELQQVDPSDQWASPGRRSTRVLKHCHSRSSAIRF